jgi:TrmH family RNA methyltransferase
MPEPIGLHNPRIQRLRRLLGRRSAREDDGCFVLEGPHAIEAALAAGVELLEVFVEASALALVPAGVTPVLVADGVLARVGSTVTPQPIMAVAPLPSLGLDALAGATFVLVAAGVSDPGNLGTMARSAEAAGADALVTTAGSVDPFSPKCVRASAGAIVQLPVLVDLDPAALRALGLRLLGTAVTGGTAYDRADLVGPVALVLGNEAHGVSADIELDGLLTIPHRGRAESLNVAMAATVLCFEVARQRSR